MKPRVEAKMRTLLVCAGMAALALAVGACDDTTNFVPRDFSAATTDAGAGTDSSITYTASTAHMVDTMTSGEVALTGLYVLSTASRHFNKTAKTCEWSFFVQDVACTTPPCGLAVYTSAPAASTVMSGSDCPFVDQSSTPLATIKKGDTIDVQGAIKYFKDKTTGGPNFHYILCDTVTKSAVQANMPAPMSVSDPSIFVVHSGSGWTMYEGTYVKVQPSTGKLTIATALDNFGDFTVTPGNASFGTTFVHAAADAGMFPMMGAQYTSISGVVNNDFGGTVEPLSMSDYVP
jgi:hypothetical protein